jgi:hypothetical protein
MCKNGESKTTQIMMATVPYVTSGSGLKKFLADDFCWTECTNTLNIFLIILEFPAAQLREPSL